VIDQSSIDLVQLVGGGLKKVAGTNGGEWAGACPFCGGRDRFRVWPEQGRWWCRQCERSGDAVSFVQQRKQVSFAAALRGLGLQGQTRSYQPAPAPARPPEPSEPPPEAWQTAARAFVEASITHLRGSYQKPLDWLHRRGYHDATIEYGQIGYHPGAGAQGDQCYVSRSAWGLPDDGRKLWLPRGVVIPWLVDGLLWKLFIRRPIPPGAWEAVRRPPQDAPVPRGIPTTVLRCLRDCRSYLTVEALARRCDLAVGDVQSALTDLAPRQVQQSWYGLRMWIELGFRALKGVGWQWQRTRRTDPERVARHWLVLAVATLWVLGCGTRADDAETLGVAPGRVRVPPDPPTPTGQPVVGLFQRGLSWALRRSGAWAHLAAAVAASQCLAGALSRCPSSAG
jgi:hypothetical protein